MTLHRKFVRLAAGSALLLVAAGCSGINARQNMSPASFFLPGLIRLETPPAPGESAWPAPGPARQIAQIR